MKVLLRALRSPRLAVWTIVAVAAYAAVASIIERSDYSAPYRTPLFLALATLLASSTAACALERTRRTIRSWRSDEVSPEARERVLLKPMISLPTPYRGELVMERVDGSLRSLGMSVRRHDDMLQARSHAVTVLGSPVFHWALTLLFVVIVLGQLTRSEGLMGIVVGSSKPDIEDSYGKLEVGPWAGGLSGALIGVPRVDWDHTAGEVSRGASPFVELRTARGDLLASGHVYANRPLRHGSMLVHSASHGLAVVVSLQTPSGAGENEVLLDYIPGQEQVEPNGFTLSGSDDAPVASVLFDLPPQPRDGTTRRVRVHIASGPASPADASAREIVLAEGESVDLGSGVRLTIERLTSYARLSVVDDWSVPFIYVLFAVAAVGLSLAIFAPYRTVRVLVVDGPEGVRVHALVRHGRGEPGFPARVERALAGAVKGGGHGRDD